jgi:hypothetical protein
MGGSRNGEKRMNIMLFPNEHDRDNWLLAGENKIIGKHGELEIQPPFGKDVVTVVTGNTRDAIRVRGLGVVQPATSQYTGSGRPSDSGTVASDTCFMFYRQSSGIKTDFSRLILPDAVACFWGTE